MWRGWEAHLEQQITSRFVAPFHKQCMSNALLFKTHTSHTHIYLYVTQITHRVYRTKPPRVRRLRIKQKRIVVSLSQRNTVIFVCAYHAFTRSGTKSHWGAKLARIKPIKRSWNSRARAGAATKGRLTLAALPSKSLFRRSHTRESIFCASFRQ